MKRYFSLQTMIFTTYDYKLHFLINNNFTKTLNNSELFMEDITLCHGPAWEGLGTGEAACVSGKTWAR